MGIGKLVVFEGIDGCGKSTQLQVSAAALRSRGINVLCTRQPTAYYRDNPKVRAYLDHGDPGVGMEALCLLAAEDRRRHLAEIVLPSLTLGSWVLCDRYVYSTYAFVRARGVEPSFVRQVNEGVRRPDLTVLLDVSPEEARRRVLSREKGAITKFEERNLEFMAAVRAAFLECRDESFEIMDALLPSERLHVAITACINCRLRI
jgi:dTMP kinase